MVQKFNRTIWFNEKERLGVQINRNDAICKVFGSSYLENQVRGRQATLELLSSLHTLLTAKPCLQ